MELKSLIMLKVLMNRYHPGGGEAALRSISREEIKQIISQNVHSQDASLILKWHQDQILMTHYSWLVPVIQKLPKGLQLPTVSSLSEVQAAILLKTLHLGDTPKRIADPMKKFLLENLYQRWEQKEAIPLEYLPPTPLIALGQLSKAELVELIDFLALYDVAETVRHIVDKKNLQLIYQGLSPKKQQFLRICLHQKEKVALPKLNLDKWDKSPKSLENALHRRGLFRLGRALSGQDSRFLWVITHKLDTGRGNILMKYVAKDDLHGGIISSLVLQVQSVINFLKKE